MSEPAKEFSKGFVDFIDDAKIEATIAGLKEDPVRVREIIAKSMNKEPLQVDETAALLGATSPELVEEIFAAARELKKNVYGNRIVLFAPLYIGNHCINDCKYCGFRKTLRTTVRKTLTTEETIQQVTALENDGHKRLILVFGEHPAYTPEFIADTVRTVYSVRSGKSGEIRRVNINAAPLNSDGFRIVKESGIGTYQIFQETYHKKTYAANHPADTRKGDYAYRLDGLSRAFEAGCDDMGIGALFGLYDWRFEVLGLVTHSLYLQRRYGVGPHTISFPRMRPAHGVDMEKTHFVSDYDFKRLVAILRLSVPYTGLIMTARETAEIRREVLEFGVSQIDAGTRLELAGYTDKDKSKQDMKREQFQIGDVRSLDDTIRELLQTGYIPSFCTSCYRLGRTGEHFMEYAIPGFIGQFCTPNALLTLEEYLMDYASAETLKIGEKFVDDETAKISDPVKRENVLVRLKQIRDEGKRDLYF